MKTSQRGIDLIKSFEGCRLAAYPDPGTGDSPWTIGYGHTGAEVRKGYTITQAQADMTLVNDLAKFESSVSDMVIMPMTQGMFDALVSFAYNAGPANLRNSTLLKKLNSGDKQGAADEFLKWVNAAGHVLAGLVKRRTSERKLFLS